MTVRDYNHLFDTIFDTLYSEVLNGIVSFEMVHEYEYKLRNWRGLDITLSHTLNGREVILEINLPQQEDGLIFQYDSTPDKTFDTIVKIWGLVAHTSIKEKIRKTFFAVDPSPSPDGSLTLIYEVQVAIGEKWTLRTHATKKDMVEAKLNQAVWEDLEADERLRKIYDARKALNRAGFKVEVLQLSKVNSEGMLLQITR